MQFRVISAQKQSILDKPAIQSDNGEMDKGATFKHNRNKPVTEHFNKPEHTSENLQLAVIKKVKSKTK